MSTIHCRSFAIAATAILATAGSIAAQERPLGLLNEFEVRTLVARGEPVDNGRLLVHFNLLADRYAVEATRHLSMARSFGGNPNHSFAAGMSEHCKRIADLHTRSATTVRELAEYHRKLADGIPATLPRDGSRFQSGTGAPEPTDRELDRLAAKASTRTEHLELEEYFLTLAKRYITDANEHVTLALAYRGGRFAQAAVHHDHLANVARDAAKEATRAAGMHKQFSTIGR